MRALWLVLLLVTSAFADKRPLSPELSKPVGQVYAGLQRTHVALAPAVNEIDRSLKGRLSVKGERERMRARRTRSRMQKAVGLHRAVGARLSPLVPAGAGDAELLKQLRACEAGLGRILHQAREILTLQIENPVGSREVCLRMNRQLRSDWKRFDQDMRKCRDWPVGSN